MSLARLVSGASVNPPLARPLRLRLGDSPPRPCFRGALPD